MKFKIITLILGALLLAAPFASAAAADRSSTRVVVIDDDDTRATVTIDGGRVQVIARGDGDTSVHEFDLSQLGALIDGAVTEAMADLDDVLDEELTIHVDDDRMLHVEHGEQVCAVNMQVLAQEIRNTLSNINLDLGRELHRTSRVHSRHEQGDTADLKEELDQLKAELKKLRRELDEVH